MIWRRNQNLSLTFRMEPSLVHHRRWYGKTNQHEQSTGVQTSTKKNFFKISCLMSPPKREANNIHSICWCIYLPFFLLLIASNKKCHHCSHCHGESTEPPERSSEMRKWTSGSISNFPSGCSPADPTHQGTPNSRLQMTDLKVKIWTSKKVITI